MAALTGPRNTPRRGDSATLDLLSLPVKAATKIHQGSLVAIDGGYAAPARTATGLIAAGRAEETVDNTSGAAGDQKATVRAGVFRFANSAAADAIAQADVGKECFLVDDQTVAKTDAAATRSVAGVIVEVDSAGVWVEVRPSLSRALALAILGATLPTPA